MAFMGADPIRSEIVNNNVILEQVDHFKYLGNLVSFTNEFDVNYELINAIKMTDILIKIEQKVIN